MYRHKKNLEFIIATQNRNDFKLIFLNIYKIWKSKLILIFSTEGFFLNLNQLMNQLETEKIKTYVVSKTRIAS